MKFALIFDSAWVGSDKSVKHTLPSLYLKFFPYLCQTALTQMHYAKETLLIGRYGSDLQSILRYG